MKYFVKRLLIHFYLACTGGVILFGGHSYVIAEDFKNTKDRDIYKSLGGDQEDDSALPSNPMKMMEMIRKATAMENATSPTDALDEALKAFDEQSPDNFLDQSLIDSEKF